jgi:hypothetical protein
MRRPITQLLTRELIGSDGGSADEVGQPDAPTQQLLLIGGVQTAGGIDLMVGQPRLMQ